MWANPYLEIALATLIWSLSGPYVRWIGLPPAYLSFIRCSVPLLIMGALITRQKGWRRLILRSKYHGIWNRYTAIASVCNLIRSLLYFWGFSLIPVGHAVLLMYTWPLMVSVLAILILGEPFKPWQMVMGAIALVGVAIIQMDHTTLSHNTFVTGSIVILGAALANAGMLISLQKNKTHLHRFEMVFVQNTLGALILAPIGVAMITTVPIEKTLISIAMSIAVGIVGFSLFFSALKKLPTGQSAILSYLEIFFTVGLATLFLGEPITSHKLIGGAFILTGSLGAQLIRLRKPRAV